MGFSTADVGCAAELDPGFFEAEEPRHNDVKEVIDVPDVRRQTVELVDDHCVNRAVLYAVEEVLVSFAIGVLAACDILSNPDNLPALVLGVFPCALLLITKRIVIIC